MLDPRIYRTGLIVSALALVILAFSLRNQQTALSPTLAPDAFDGATAFHQLQTLAAQDPSRRPGSWGDESLATEVSTTFSQDGFQPTTTTFLARTVDGTRTLENVVGVRPGDKNGSIVVVASRDALGQTAKASLSGTAVLLELARDLQGETLNRTVVLASTSGADGAAGVRRLAADLPQPVDAVVVLGDLASSHVSGPVVVPWSSNATVASPRLRNTVAANLASQTPFTAEGYGLGGQFAHLAFPLTLGQQGPFGARGIPAVEVTLSGETGPGADAPVSMTTVSAMGRAMLETISALDSGSTVAGPSSYLLLDGKVVPGWSLSLFVLALLVPVAMATVDGVARARRRGNGLGRSLLFVLAAALPFALAVVVVLIGRAIGAIGVAPPGAVAPGAVPLHGSGVVVLVLAGLVAVGGGAAVAMTAFRKRTPSTRDARAEERRRRAARAGAEGSGLEGPAAALLVVMCAVTLAIWLTNPFAALLFIPALHLWLWAVNPGPPLPTPARLVLVAIGAVPVVLLVVYYANALGYGPVAVVWQAALLVAGHGVSLLGAAEWSVALGCLVSAAALSVLAGRRPKAAPVPVTVRGPVTYAGPGSLGGTKSALRR